MSETETKPTINKLKQCACLTGTDQVCTATTRKVFAQGHDARMSSRLAVAVASTEDPMTEADAVTLIKKAGGGMALISKTTHSAKLRAQRAAGGDKPKVEKKAKKPSTAEQAIESAGPQIKGTKVIVYHGKAKSEAIVVANASEELVARHRRQGKNCDHQIEVEEGPDGKPEIFTK